MALGSMRHIQRSVVGGEFLKVRYRDGFAIFENGKVLFREAVQVITGFVGDDDWNLDKNGLGTELDLGFVGCGMRFKKAKVNIVAFPQDGRIAGISCRVDVRPGSTRATAATATLTDGKGGKKKRDEEEQTRATG